MDKPISMSVKDYLVRIMSVRTKIPEKTIEAVIAHQFEDVQKAMQIPGINSIEVSGFGKFIFNINKAKKKWGNVVEKRAVLVEELKDPDLTESKKKSNELKIEYYEKFLNALKPKIDGARKDNRRVEEQVDTTKGDEGDDRESVTEQDADMQRL